MMGQHKSDPQLFNYAVNLEKRVRAAHPLRRVKATIDFGFVREEVAHCYGKNGNESVALEVERPPRFVSSHAPMAANSPRPIGPPLRSRSAGSCNSAC